jgi:hypothetical protein
LSSPRIHDSKDAGQYAATWNVKQLSHGLSPDVDTIQATNLTAENNLLEYAFIT